LGARILKEAVKARGNLKEASKAVKVKTLRAMRRNLQTNRNK